jgi:hypothetical protein
MPSIAFAVEEVSDLFATHLIEIVWYGDLTCHETKTPHRSAGWSVERRDSDQRLTCFGDNE